MKPDIDEVMDAVSQLGPDEQHEVLERVSSLLASPELNRDDEEELDRRLLRAGVIERIPEDNIAGNVRRERRLAQVAGKPVSETIVEER